MTERSNISVPSLFLQFLVLVFMAILTYPSNYKYNDLKKHTQRKKKNQQEEISKITKQPSSSWDQIKNLLTCKQIQVSKIHDPSRVLPSNINHNNNVYTSCSSICTLRDVVHGNTRVVHRADDDHNSQESRRRSTTSLTLGQQTKKSSHAAPSSSSSLVRSSGARGASNTGPGMQLRKLSGCYECHAILHPTRYPLPRTAICVCSECGEVFPKIESLELHQAVRHAVSELGPEDSSRNIVEIIFKSSWFKKDSPICKIERILKVHNTQRTIQRFEDYREAVKTRANSSASAAKSNGARCAADGNELLRFHCATLTCSLGARGSTSLCGSIPPACGVCTIIRHGFQGSKINGTIGTTASSGRADNSIGGSGTRRAMLVCRVVAGRVRRCAEGDDGGSYDSVAGSWANHHLEELHVFSSRAILACFVVIYKALHT